MAPHLRTSNETHPASSAFSKDSDAEHPFYRSTLFREFARRPSVTTMESKFFVSSRVGEFWCTLTSPVYASPCIFWTISDLPSSVHIVLSCCALTAVFSTAYHMLLTKVHPRIPVPCSALNFLNPSSPQILSTVDVAQATITFYLVALLLAGIVVVTACSHFPLHPT